MSCIFAKKRFNHKTLATGISIYPRSLVFTARDKIRPIFAKLKICDGFHVRSLVVVDLFPRLDVEQCDFSRLVSGYDDSRCTRERANCRFRPDRSK